MAGRKQFPRVITIKGCTWHSDRLYPHINGNPEEACKVCGRCTLPDDLIVLDREENRVYVTTPAYDEVAIYKNVEYIVEEPTGCGTTIKHKLIKLILQKVIPYNVYQLGLA